MADECQRAARGQRPGDIPPREEEDHESKSVSFGNRCVDRPARGYAITRCRTSQRVGPEARSDHQASGWRGRRRGQDGASFNPHDTIQALDDGTLTIDVLVETLLKYAVDVITVHTNHSTRLKQQVARCTLPCYNGSGERVLPSTRQRTNQATATGLNRDDTAQQPFASSCLGRGTYTRV